MVEQRICNFCGINIEPGTGRLFVKKDGQTFSFCSSKCYKNQIKLKKVPRMTEWTAAHRKEKETAAGARRIEEKKPAKKVVRKTRKVKTDGPDKKDEKAEKAPKEPSKPPKKDTSKRGRAGKTTQEG